MNTVADNETIRRELHAAIFGVWDHIKNHCQVPGVRERAATWALDWIGHIPGKRESRRFEGDHILTENDVLAGLARVPSDVVAYGGWPIDLHPPDGVYSPDRPCHNPPLPGLYGIPYRCLYSRTIANLFLAGRDISTSHAGHGSTRVMKTCAVIGEASGTAAALAIERGLTPRALARDGALVNLLQQTLLRAGAFLPQVENRDPGDLARQPGVVISSTSRARLRLDDDDLANPSGWEHAGLSTLESRQDQPTPSKRSLPEWVAADSELAQALVLSGNQLTAVTLRLRSLADQPRPVALRIRPATHLRDFGARLGDSGDQALEAIVPPGESSVTFRPTRPFVVEPNRPVAVILPPTPDVSWGLSLQEPPGTQAGRWDESLGYWRWLHGTFRFSVEPESAPYDAANVTSGTTRPERRANLWISDPAQSLPQLLQLDWPDPVGIGRVELTFDSSLSGWVWEGAFPSIVRDYRVEVGESPQGPWHGVATVHGNYQRRRVHDFPARRIQSLRLIVEATNGMPTARIVEIRAYAS